MARPAIEKLPDIEDLLGFTQKAEQDAQTLLNMAVNLRHLQELQRTEGLSEDDVIPGQVSNGKAPKTFKEQYELIRTAYSEKWQRIIDTEGESYRGVVEAKLQEAKK